MKVIPNKLLLVAYIPLNGNIELHGQKQVEIHGSYLIAEQGDIRLTGHEKISITAAAQNAFSAQTSASHDISGGISTAEEFNAAFYENKYKQKEASTQWANSYILAKNGNLQMNSIGDIIIQGAIAYAQDVNVDTYGKLHIETLQDTEKKTGTGLWYGFELRQRKQWLFPNTKESNARRFNLGAAPKCFY